MARYSFEAKVRVAIIEENPVEREYLRALVAAAPGVAVSAMHPGIEGALPRLRKELPDLVLIDLDTRSKVQVEWLRQLHKELPHTSLLVLSAEKGSRQFFETLEAGISGWLQKPCTADQLLRAILVLQEGGAVLCSQAARMLLDYFEARGTSLHRLTGREQEVMRLLSEGCWTDDIAARMGVTRKTLRTHISNILEKMKVNSRAEALAKYLNPSGAAAQVTDH